MNRRQAKRYAAVHLADLADLRAGLIKGHCDRGECWDRLSTADSRRVVTALTELGEELRARGQGRPLTRAGVVVHPNQATLFEEATDGA